MKKLIILTFIFIGCNEKKSTDSTKLTQTTTAHFDKDNHLFLNFYHGMSPKEYSDALLDDIKNRKIFPGMNQDEMEAVNKKLLNPLNSGEEYRDFKYVAYLDSINYNTELSHEYVFEDPFNRPFLYNLSIDGKDYYTQIYPSFYEDSTLAGISLNVHLYNIYSLEGQNLSDKMLEMKNIILKLYTTKYGKPKIRKDHKNPYGFGISGEGFWRLWDKNTYTFKLGLKTIVLNQLYEGEQAFVGARGSLLSTNISYNLTKNIIDETVQADLDRKEKEKERKEKEKERKDSIEYENLIKSIKKQKNKSTIDAI